jgi:PAS domain S-box-containing protein
MTLPVDVEQSAFLGALFEGSSDGLCLVAPDGTVLRANQQWLRSTGLHAEQVVGADILDLFPESGGLAREVHARARRGERVRVPVHQQSILGRDTWWDGSVAPVAMEGGVGLLITARELHRDPRELEAEAARCEREWRLARAVEGSQDGIFDVDLASGTSRRSDWFARRLGLAPAALPPTLEGFYSAVWPEDLPGLRAAIDALLAGRSEALDHTFRARHADGAVRWFRSRGRITGRAGGAPGFFAGTISEVTGQVRAEAALREALARNVALVQELRESLAHVRTLSGLVPICMHCHKVRNDQGFWDRIEEYLADHTGAEVSHGLCPECLERHYPGRGRG